MIPLDLSRFEQLKASGDLPSPKGVALAIVRATMKDDVSIAEVGRLVKTDPAFVGRLIKAANGAASMGRRPVASVQDALMLMGLPAVRGMALGFSLVNGYGKGMCRGFPYQDFWSACLVMSIAMQAITARNRVAVVEEAFCAGLLARIGELALATLFPVEYGKVLAAAAQYPHAPLIELERREFVMNHAELSAAMLADWGLPKVFVEPVYYHENPTAASFPEGSRPMMLTLSLAMARQMADVCMAEDHRRPELMPGLFALAQSLGWTKEEIGPLYDQVVADWQEWGSMLSVHTRNPPPFDEIQQACDVAETSGVAGAIDSASLHQPMRILVVDDDPVMRNLLRALLEKAGHEVMDADNGQTALGLALESQPHIMIIDWLMPNMDGLSLIRSLRQSKAGRTIYILMLTSLEEEERLVEAFENGADDFLHKPLIARVLSARLRAGQRVVRMQQEIERDREEIRHFAAELAVTNRRLQEAALTDPLTGLPNRRYAMDRLQQEWSGANRSGRPLCCMMMDLDEFKRINDHYGHDAGDAILRHCASVVKRVLRQEDVVCRLGGDEFLILCPDAGLEDVVQWAERIRRTVSGMPLNIGRLNIKATVSIGAAQRASGMLTPEDLIKQADRGLYLAKQRGRNQVAVY